MKKLFICMALSITAICAQAETTNIFCAAANGDYWYWATDVNNNTIQVNGKWEHTLLNSGTYFYYFNVSEENYIQLKTLCRQGETPQPANDSLSKWYIFQITKSDNSQYFAPGRYTNLTNLNSSYQLTFIRAK